MYKIDRRGGGVQKSYTRNIPKAEGEGTSLALKDKLKVYTVTDSCFILVLNVTVV